MQPIYPCPPQMMWSPEDKNRKCSECDKKCYDVFARTFRPNNKPVLNYCSKKCFDDYYKKKYHS